MQGYLLPGDAVNRASPLNRGLVSWYMVLPNRIGGGGNTLRDLCRRNHGTLTNGPTWSGSRAPGAFGSISLDGSNDYINLGTGNRFFGSSLTNPFTIVCWIRTTIASSSG